MSADSSTATGIRFDPRRLVVATLSLLFFVILLRTAWLSDDAYVTLRTVDNFIHGYGLRWNIADRVQAYTHPLWMFLLVIVYGICRNEYYGTLALSFGCALFGFHWLGRRLATSTWAAVFALSILLLSRAFVEFSTSGLENPLTHLLLILFLWIYVSPSRTRRLFWLSLLAGLATLNRMDILLLLAPVLAVECWSERRWWTLYTVMIGFTPFIAWELFSVVYYGFPFPNTAYAKLHTGVETLPLLKQGFAYWLDAFTRDPLTPTVILVGVALPAFVRDRRLAPVSLGMFLYCIYIVRIGGDFMTGRFFTAPLVCGVVLLTQLDYSKLGAYWWAPCLPVALLGLVGPKELTWRTGQSFSGPPYANDQGIGDERWAYYQWTGLLNLRHDQPMPNGDLVNAGQRERARGKHVVINSWPGLTGFYAGPDVHIVDALALSDALLARLPMNKGVWRIGHYERTVPDGYVATLQTGRNVIKDATIARLFDDVSLIIRGRIWSARRWRAIVRSNLGF